MNGELCSGQNKEGRRGVQRESKGEAVQREGEKGGCNGERVCGARELAQKKSSEEKSEGG